MPIAQKDGPEIVDHAEVPAWDREWEPQPCNLDGGLHAGSSVYTLYGTQKIGELAPGDVVMTVEYGLQRICEIGRKPISDPLSHLTVQLRPLPKDPVAPSYLCPTQKVLVRRSTLVARVLGRSQAAFEAGHLGPRLGARLYRPEFHSYLVLTLEKPATLWTPTGFFECAGEASNSDDEISAPALSQLELELWQSVSHQPPAMQISNVKQS